MRGDGYSIGSEYNTLVQNVQIWLNADATDSQLQC